MYTVVCFRPTVCEHLVPSRWTSDVPSTKTLAKCSSGAVQQLEVEDCGSAEQLPAVNVSNCINVKQGIDKKSAHAQQLISGWVETGKMNLLHAEYGQIYRI